MRKTSKRGSFIRSQAESAMLAKPYWASGLVHIYLYIYILEGELHAEAFGWRESNGGNWQDYGLQSSTNTILAFLVVGIT